MSFKFNWNFFNQPSLDSKARDVLMETMNKGSLPPVIVEKIRVDQLDFGTIAPDLEILEIGDLASDKFRGIFKLEYNGDAKLSLRTTVEANPLALSFEQPNLQFVSPEFESVSRSLKLPLTIDLSEIQLSAIIILVFSKDRGLTLVFRNDPLQSVKVSSTFDFLPGVSQFLKAEIEERLRESFREDIPEVLYQLSQNMDDGGDAFTFHSEHTQVGRPQNTVAYSDVQVNPRACPEADIKTLTECQRTLSLFTPELRDSVTMPTLDRFEEQLYQNDHYNNHHRHKKHRTFSKVGSISELSQVVRNTKHKNVRPKRRVIDLSMKGNTTIAEETSTSFSEDTASTTTIEEDISTIIDDRGPSVSKSRVVGDAKSDCYYTPEKHSGSAKLSIMLQPQSTPIKSKCESNSTQYFDSLPSPLSPPPPPQYQMDPH